MEKQFRALANKNRLAILDYLRRQELICSDSTDGCNVGDIAGQFNLALSTISHHLKVLEEADLINCEQRGQFVCCTLNQHTMEELQTFFSNASSKKTKTKS